MLITQAEQEEEARELQRQAAFYGLMIADLADEPQVAYLWPENLASWNLFQAVATQWVTGMGGPVGLDYTAVEVVMRLLEIPRRDRKKRFQDVQIMERATLAAWSEKEAANG